MTRSSTRRATRGLVARGVAAAALLVPPAAASAQTRPAAPPAVTAPPTVGAASEAARVALPPVVFVVRHAEKAPEPGDDPGLSAEGRARAAALQAALADAGVSAVVVTPRRRTSQTAAPLAAARGLTPEVVPFGAGVAEHAAAVAAAARRHAGGAVLVVGHSNTVPAIVAALGGPRLGDLCDAAYATLFVVRPAAGGVPASVARAAYGPADPPGAAACAGTPAR
jgi:phosphohistidine phosphatase SixA